MRRKTLPKRQILVRVHQWMYNAMKAEARAQTIPTSVNRLVIEAILAKYRNLARNMNDDKAVAAGIAEIKAERARRGKA